MYKAHCLCGKVEWQLLAEPYAIYNCHCRMCQKIHGAAFGTYAFVRPTEFKWISSTEHVVQYRSSEALVRSSCNVCGSVVPYASQAGDHWVAPAGCHSDIRKPDYNIFVADNSPWHTISGNLPACDAYPEESGIAAVEGVSAPTPTDGNIKGSCLCGEVTYEITEPFKLARNCHCTRCRNGRAAAHASNGFVSYDGLAFLTGEELLQSYKVPEAKFFTQVFCKKCSSLMPRKDEGRGISIVPMGSLDNDPDIKTSDHIFVDDKAQWHDITDDLPQHRQAPPA